jgi:hypothetical protein
MYACGLSSPSNVDRIFQQKRYRGLYLLFTFSVQPLPDRYKLLSVIFVLFMILCGEKTEKLDLEERDEEVDITDGFN